MSLCQREKWLRVLSVSLSSRHSYHSMSEKWIRSPHGSHFSIYSGTFPPHQIRSLNLVDFVL